MGCGCSRAWTLEQQDSNSNSSAEQRRRDACASGEHASLDSVCIEVVQESKPDADSLGEPSTEIRSKARRPSDHLHRVSAKILSELGRGWVTPDPAHSWSESQTLAEFCAQRPGLPSHKPICLNRGWSTPDPEIHNREVDLTAVSEALASEERGMKEGPGHGAENVTTRTTDWCTTSSSIQTLIPARSLMWNKPANTVIFLDWDDTVLPSTWLKTRPWFADWFQHRTPTISGMSHDDSEELRELDLSARSLLLTMAALGQIYCITASKPPWQSTSMSIFLPGVADVWGSLGVRVVYCMYDSPASQKDWTTGQATTPHRSARARIPSDEKQRAMLDCLARFHKGSNCNVLSVGDGQAEAHALRRIGLERTCQSDNVKQPQLLAKIVRLLPRSTGDCLSKQLVLLRWWLMGILEARESMEVDFAVDEHELMANHFRFAGRGKSLEVTSL
eukprot:TRINITY_DN24258_c0_g1_i1.p1 TRINITY_DN24258_c0_g1~~TRINITY_DN24258_c0_g1_i1.p1  ORF type:complete len:447 (+),score=58.26 TRINITY_DN24258_c0_g1_i1:21-1361(+)